MTSCLLTSHTLEHTHTHTLARVQEANGQHRSTHHCLNHLHPLLADGVDTASNVHHSLLLNLVQDSVNGDVGSSTTHTSTAVEGTHTEATQCYCPHPPPLPPTPQPTCTHHPIPAGSTIRAASGWLVARPPCGGSPVATSLHPVTSHTVKWNWVILRPHALCWTSSCGEG